MKNYYILKLPYINDFGNLCDEWALLKASLVNCPHDNKIVFLNDIEVLNNPKHLIIGPRWYVYGNDTTMKAYKKPFRFFSNLLEERRIKNCNDDDTAKLLFELEYLM